MKEEANPAKPVIDFDEAMRISHERYAKVYKALAELEAREKAAAEVSKPAPSEDS